MTAASHRMYRRLKNNVNCIKWEKCRTARGSQTRFKSCLLIIIWKIELSLSRLNKEIVMKEHYETMNLSHGDIVEIIHFVGGG